VLLRIRDVVLCPFLCLFVSVHWMVWFLVEARFRLCFHLFFSFVLSLLGVVERFELRRHMVFFFCLAVSFALEHCIALYVSRIRNWKHANVDLLSGCPRFQFRATFFGR